MINNKPSFGPIYHSHVKKLYNRHVFTITHVCTIRPNIKPSLGRFDIHMNIAHMYICKPDQIQPSFGPIEYSHEFTYILPLIILLKNLIKRGLPLD